MANPGFKPLTPAERIKYLRREHGRVEHPVGHCRKDRQNWPCDTIAGLDAAEAAVRERIAAEIDGFAQLARDAAGGYPADPGPPTTGHARSEMQGRAGAYVKAALIARGDGGGGEGWGEP